MSLVGMLSLTCQASFPEAHFLKHVVILDLHPACEQCVGLYVAGALKRSLSDAKGCFLCLVEMQETMKRRRGWPFYPQSVDPSVGLITNLAVKNS